MSDAELIVTTSNISTAWRVLSAPVTATERAKAVEAELRKAETWIRSVIRGDLNLPEFTPNCIVDEAAAKLSYSAHISRREATPDRWFRIVMQGRRCVAASVQRLETPKTGVMT